MNKIWVGCLISSLFIPAAGAQQTLSLEERLAQMEQRLKSHRAAGAKTPRRKSAN